MEYTELRIKLNKDELETAETALIENGFASMMIDDPDDVIEIAAHPEIYRYDYLDSGLTEDLGRKPVITIYFSDDEEGREEHARAVALLDGLKQNAVLNDVETEDRRSGDDSEWLYKWQEHFRPTRVGSRIVVKPSWEEYIPEEGDLVIEMDPGMAFGSGLHETTSMCIRALERILAEHETDTPVRVLDVGTGTGILAIAGVLLGAEEALGIDIDTDAVRVAAENIEHNGLRNRISVQYGDLTEGVEYTADILAANLMADLVIRLSDAAAGHLKRGGWYITSGILDIKEETVTKAIRDAGFAVEEVLHDGEWCAVIARKI